MRDLIWVLVPVLATFAMTAPARANETAGVYLAVNGDWDDQAMEDILRAGLSQAPGLTLLSAAAPDAIFITIPDGIARKNKDAGGEYAYTAVFSHDGRKLGESLETCPGEKPKACADQMAADARSAAALP